MSTNIEKPSFSPNKRAEKDEKKIDNNKIENSDITHAALDTMAGIDTAESITGKISETLSKSKDKDGSSSGGAKKQFDPAVLRAQLLEGAPPKKIMIQQIEKEIKKEIKYLHKKAMKMITSPGEINYFEMNNLLKKMRELKSIIKTILKASVEGVKTLWLRFVHGIM